MKTIDKIIRAWRVGIALRHIPKSAKNFFDIGCHDLHVLKLLSNRANKLDGCDPVLKNVNLLKNSTLLKGMFPDVVRHNPMQQKYDVIFALAVFEHFSEIALLESSEIIADMLTDQGILIVTVPHPFVDNILDALQAAKLIEGQALEEHHGFDPRTLKAVLSKHLMLKDHIKFQFGLNNLFIFNKKIA